MGKKKVDTTKFGEWAKNRRFVNSDEAAYWLGISRRTLYNNLSTGSFPKEIRPSKWGSKLRFDRVALERYADKLLNRE